MPNKSKMDQIRVLENSKDPIKPLVKGDIDDHIDEQSKVIFEAVYNEHQMEFVSGKLTYWEDGEKVEEHVVAGAVSPIIRFIREKLNESWGLR
jgi:hypothetical protein